MKFKLDKDQVIVVFLGVILLVSLIETYIRLSREERELNKELKKLDIEINTLQLRYENEKRLSEQIHRLSEVFPDHDDDAPPADTEPEPDEKRLTIREWEKELGFEILDPDGFDRTDGDLYEHEFTRAEFLRGARGSTVRGIENLHNAVMGIVPGSDEAAPSPEPDHISHEEKKVEEIIPPVPGLDVMINQNKFWANVDLAREEAAPSPEPDHIPHEEKMIEEVATTTEEVDDGVIRAPFDGEIIEMRAGCFTIKAADRGMKITFDFDFCQVALNEIVKKGQILGNKR